MSNTLFGRLRLVCVASLVGAVVSCGGPADESVGEFQAAITVADSAAFNAILAFQVVIASASKGGKDVTCAELPVPYREGDLEHYASASTPWNGDSRFAEVDVKAPFNTDVLVLALGKNNTAIDYARKRNYVHIVARGCKAARFDKPAGSNTTKFTAEVQLNATAGRACTADSDCEYQMACHKGTGFLAGYCAKTGCKSDDECLPGTVCINDGATGLCAQLCAQTSGSATSACNTAGNFSCNPRRGPSGCHSVCVNPNWLSRC